MLSAKEKCHQLSLQLQIIFQTRRFGMLMVLTFGITSIHVSGQDHMEFVLVDTFSKTPVVDAFLFIEGSSIGTTSDTKGVARLPKEALLNRTIVITHIQYENVYLEDYEIDQRKRHTIWLNPRPIDLDEILVRENNGNKKNRKKWMRSFVTELFGPKINRRQIELANPEVLWFEDTDSLLEAHAIDNLIIHNKSLGYKLLLTLEYFSIDVLGDVRYRGHVHFTDTRDQQKRPRRIERQRKKIYEESSRLFFRTLLHSQPINQEFFRFGSTKEIGSRRYHFDPLEKTELQWSSGPLHDTLWLKDHLTVITKNRSMRLQHSGQRLGNLEDIQKATSFLRSSSGRFVLNTDGDIVNKTEIEESGFWSDFRIAAALPWDYEGSFRLTSPKGQAPILDSLLRYQGTQTREKVQVVVSQREFSLFDKMHFQCWLVDATEHKPSRGSKIVYVDLISPSDHIVRSWEFHTQRGMSGSHQWDGSQVAGTYRLRAYTNAMRNEHEFTFYEHRFEVKDYLGHGPLTNNKETGHVPLDEENIDVFFEGGDFTMGIVNNIVVRIHDGLGKGRVLEGYIADQDESSVSLLKTNAYGMAMASVSPSAEKRYHVGFVLGQDTIRRVLPRPLEEGVQIHANGIDKQSIYVTVHSSDSFPLQDVFLIGHVRGSVCLYEPAILHGQQFKISKASLPPGILHLALFDGRQKVLSERLIFNDWGLDEDEIKVTGLPSTFYPNQAVNIGLALDSILPDTPIFLSASIINLDLVPAPHSQTSVRSELLLHQDLGIYVEDAEMLLKDINPRKRFLLDLILQTQKWQRFSWEQLLRDSGGQDQYEVEKGYRIAGFTTRTDDTARIRSHVMLNTLDTNFLHKAVVTDARGEFVFADLPFQDSMMYIIQARRFRKKSNLEDPIKGDRKIDIHLVPRSIDSVPSMRQVFGMAATNDSIGLQERDELRRKSLIDQEHIGATRTIDLDAVEVTSKRTYTSNRPGGKFFRLDGMDWIAPRTQSTRLLNLLSPRYNFRPGPHGTLLAEVRNNYGEMVSVPVSIEIDGMGGDSEGSNMASLLRLTADDIESISIGRTSIVITTREVPRSRERYLDSGILRFAHSGFSAPTEYETDNRYQASEVDLRHVVYWDPNLTFNDKGNAKISFTTSNKPTNYLLLLEGISNTGIPIAQERLISW